MFHDPDRLPWHLCRRRAEQDNPGADADLLPCQSMKLATWAQGAREEGMNQIATAKGRGEKTALDHSNCHIWYCAGHSLSVQHYRSFPILSFSPHVGRGGNSHFLPLLSQWATCVSSDVMVLAPSKPDLKVLNSWERKLTPNQWPPSTF